MKKLQIAVLILTLLFVSACVPDEDDEEDFWNNDQTDTMSGGNSDTTGDTLPDNPTDTDSTDTTPDTSDTSDTTPDTTDTNNDPSDSDVSDSAPNDNDTTDTVPDNDSDAQPAPDNDTTPAPDNDTVPVSDDDTEPANDNDIEPTPDEDPEPANDDDTIPVSDDNTEPTNDDDTISGGLPECSSADITPCIDSSSTYIWSAMSSETKSWDDAYNYCNSRTEGGYSWRIPKISELRTLVQNCSSSQADGSCQISEECLDYIDECLAGCSSCTYDSTGTYSKFGKGDTLWSSSVETNNYMWTLDFKDASFYFAKQSGNSLFPGEKLKVRCIKK